MRFRSKGIKECHTLYAKNVLIMKRKDNYKEWKELEVDSDIKFRFQESKSECVLHFENIILFNSIQCICHISVYFVIVDKPCCNCVDRQWFLIGWTFPPEPGACRHCPQS